MAARIYSDNYFSYPVKKRFFFVIALVNLEKLVSVEHVPSAPLQGVDKLGVFTCFWFWVDGA